MYLIDTSVISEIRKRDKANPGVASFFRQVVARDEAVCLSCISVGELRRGVELVRLRGDLPQAGMLETWLNDVLDQYGDSILSLDAEAAQVWGRLCVPNGGNEINKQIAAIALAVA